MTLLEKFRKKRLIAYGFRNGKEDSKHYTHITVFYYKKFKEVLQPSENTDATVN